MSNDLLSTDMVDLVVPLDRDYFERLRTLARRNETSVLGFILSAVDEALKQTEEGAQVNVDGRTVTISATAVRHINSLLRQGEKIKAIKHVREVTGAGLKDAKNFVDGLP